MAAHATDVVGEVLSGLGAPVPVASRRRRPIRDNLEAFGIAILMAVLLKYFAIEAYQIPTSSMQPTLMGSPEAGVHDRILVDKIRYEIFEPQRWDVAVFKYPIRQNQNYVKRIVGMPGDHLLVAGGNIYDAKGDGPPRIVRKPDDLQERLWKEIYPHRRLVTGAERILGEYFQGRGAGVTWSEDGDDLVARLPAQGKAWLDYTDVANAGLSDMLWDGYPVAVARAIRQKDRGRHFSELVQDVRFTSGIRPAGTVQELRLRVSAGAPAEKPRRFVLVLDAGKGWLEAEQDGKETAKSEVVEFPLPPGETTQVSFAHVDDRLLAWRDGARVLELDTSAFAILHPIPLSGQGNGNGGRSGAAAFDVQLSGTGEVRFASPKLERDLHYFWEHYRDDLYATPGNEPARVPRTEPLVVPEGHYFMMGDNTQRSADSREWTAITVGVVPQPDGPPRMVDPRTVPESQRLTGNKRPFPPSEPVDPDENPVVLPNLDRIVLTDAIGDVYELQGEISAGPDEQRRYLKDGSGGQMWFDGNDPGTTPWHPLEEKRHFVRREHILGRALLTFWPSWPFGQHRLGFIR